MGGTGSKYSSSCRAIPELRAGVVRALSRFPEVRAVYLFGSVAAGTARADSDVDVAVVTDKPLGMLAVDMQAALVAEGIDNADLVGLATDDLAQSFEAVRQRCLLFAREDFDHDGHVSRIVREYSELGRGIVHPVLQERPGRAAGTDGLVRAVPLRPGNK